MGIFTDRRARAEQLGQLIEDGKAATVRVAEAAKESQTMAVIISAVAIVALVIASVALVIAVSGRQDEI